MPRARIKPPTCMGQRMNSFGVSSWSLTIPDLGRVMITRLSGGTVTWYINENGAQIRCGSVPRGEQAAANAAERWLVKRAELTLKLAGRKAA